MRIANWTKNLMAAGLLLAAGLQGCSCESTPPAAGDGGVDGGNGAPTVTIAAPADETELAAGDALELVGTAMDPEDGALTGDALVWQSDLSGALGTGESLTVNLTDLGTHTLTLVATDSQGLSGSASVRVVVTGNASPEVTILSPADGAAFARGETIAFECEAVDPETGPVPNAQITWTSDLDGPIGLGATVRTALGTVGTHVITCEALDDQDAAGRASLTVEVIDNFVPEVVIEAPADGSYFKSGSTISFSGTASDPEDGALTGASLVWLADGQQIGIGAGVQTALPDGDYRIALEATDSQGAVGRAEVSISVVANLPPVCAIAQPADGAQIMAEASVTFSATCTDPDGTAIPNTEIRWTSDRDGPMGIGASVTNALVTAGPHTITVCAADTADPGITGCDAVAVEVVPNRPPEVVVSAPADGATIEACTTVALRCTAADPEGSVVSYEWRSDREGALGDGAAIGWTPAQSGTHLLTCTATDAQGKAATAAVSVTVASPTVALAEPADGFVARPGQDITFAGTACDTEDGPLQGGSLVWTSDLDGRIGTGNGFATVLTAGRHVVTLTATDGQGNSASGLVTVWVNTAPVVTIDSPADAASFQTAETVSFSGTVTDPDPQDAGLLGTWRDNTLGDFATANTAALSGLVPGVHRITFRATDAAGETGTDAIGLTIPAGADPLFDQQVGPRLTTITPDPSGTSVWVGTNAGLYELDGTGTVLATWMTGNSDLPHNYVRDVLFLADGTLMVATDNGLAVCAPQGANATGTPDQCQVYRDGDLQLQDDRVRTLLELPDGRTLVGTDNCLMFSDWSLDRHQDYCQGDGGGDGLPDDRVNDLAYDPVTGGVWIATPGGASLLIPAAAPEVERRSAQTFTTYDRQDGLTDDDVRAVAVAPSGRVWFGTAGGLTLLEGRGASARFTPFTIADGLPSDSVRDVAVDVVLIGGASREVAWAATAGGLGRVDADLPSVLGITQTDGLPSNDCRSLWIDPATHAKHVGVMGGTAIYRGW